MNGFKLYISIVAVLLFLIFARVLLGTGSIVGNYGDVYLHYYPLKHLVAEHLITGKAPLWNPYIFAGQPLLANPQAAVFYPLTILFSIFPTHIAFNYFIFFHFILAAVFIYLLLSASGFTPLVRFTGSIAFVFSQFLISRATAGHPIALSGYVWLPLVILFLFTISQRSSNLINTLFAITLSFQFLSGHVQPIYLSLTVIFLLFLFRQLSFYKDLSVTFALFFLLCLVQLLPSLEFARACEKGIWPELTKTYSLDISCLVTQIFPDHFGNIIKGTFKYQNYASLYFEKYCLYFGAIMFALSIAGVFISLKSKKYFWPITSLLFSVLALGTNTYVYKWLYDTMPALDLIRVPARFYFLVIFSLILLSCSALNKFKNRKVIILAVLLITTFDLVMSAKKYIYPEDIKSYRKPSGIDMFVKPGYRLISDPETVPSNKSMLYHNMNLNGYETLILKNYVKYIGLQEKKVFTPTGLARTDLFSPLSKGLSFRYIVTKKNVPELKLAGETQTGLKVYEVKDFLPLMYFPRTINMFESDAKNVFKGINYLKNTAYSPDQETILDELPPGYPRLTGGGDLVSFVYSPAKYKAELTVAGDTSLVLSEIYYPGWKASLMNRPVELLHANKSFKAVLLPKGDYLKNNALFIYYNPISFVLGMLCTTAVLLALISLSFLSLLKRKIN
jgi:hypothetical protein